MKKWLKSVADVLLPRVCVVCGRKLNSDEKNLCLYCMAELPQTYFWERKHNPMADKFNVLIERGLDGYLTGGRLERYAYAVALFFYDGKGDYRKITQRLKYHADFSVGCEFGRMLAQRVGEAQHFEDVDVIVPVPLHWTRGWKRGYNQAEVIAKEMAHQLGIEIRADILYRSRRTRTQTKVEPTKKAANVSGAFSVRKFSLQGENYRHVLLVDDVFTTGSTLGECFKALRSVFPPEVRISVATLAFVGGA